ncbi:MAG: preprotein translocase subunit SecA [Acutalibacteraceae bacterium]|nr:preprotein translocase subunit SecA [Clostridia bacterium]MEE3449972.1 preprotein translocase subunit SecA [Acutalibacteraceae bacterium]
MGLLKALFGDYSKKELKRIKPILNKILELEDTYSEMSEEELKKQTNILKDRLAKGETTDDILPEAYAACREASWRVLGMKHFPVQIIGGIILHQGRISEMKTGEGKTLVATLPAYLNGLTGNGVHVVTVNDYLARRDSEWMGKLYRYLGLTVGLIVHDLKPEERKQAYAADITYGTNNELGFDYLRDNMVVYKENKVQRGHNFAIVDEVDSILIDEARTPLIISGPGDKSSDMYERANTLAKTLKKKVFEEIDSKEDNEDYYKENNIDYIVDEKARTATLTQVGVKKVEQFFNIENLTDPDNLEIQHHVNQAIKAHSVMKRDINYVVKDDQVIIVDEFTGRLMYGRRYNEGLHQAIEAKEGVKVESESKTLATITFQNYFRLYKKLSGMTGTAMTEEAEFGEIYKLDVVEIPTNKPVQREDLPDAIFSTEKGKFEAVIEDIIEAHEHGQPVLVGTISIEKSEQLSAMLKRRGISHNVLNAKHHEKEAEIVAQAGKKGAVTIATNMAGRGTDIILGGNAEYMAKAEMRKQGIPEEYISEATGFADTKDEEILKARKLFTDLHNKFKEEIKGEAEEVKEAGGLFIMGTERHESRRIDNQLRGRAGRQGDPGKSRFYLSGEDDLLRLFAGDRIKNIMSTFNVEENVPLESKALSRVVENSQKKVEDRNFDIRKNVLQYDDVMNKQREIIYKQRDQVLDGEDIRDTIISMIEQTIESTAERYLPDDYTKESWNFEGLKEYYKGWLLQDHDEDLDLTEEELRETEREYVVNKLTEKAKAIYEENEKLLPPAMMREAERVYLLKSVDRHWMDHIDDMDQLKQGIRLRGYAQHDPVVEYRLEGFDMFDEMIDSIRQDTVKYMLVVPKKIYEQQRLMAELQRARELQLQKHREELQKQAEANAAKLAEQEQEAVQMVLKREQIANPTWTSSDGETNRPKTVRKTVKQKVGRNDPCPCGSGKKYKKCCGLKEQD